MRMVPVGAMASSRVCMPTYDTLMWLTVSGSDRLNCPSMSVAVPSVVPTPITGGTYQRLSVLSAYYDTLYRAVGRKRCEGKREKRR